MNRRGAGIAFIFFAVVLTGIRYLSAALFANGFGAQMFSTSLEYSSGHLKGYSIICLVIGVLFLIVAEIDEFDKQ
ncbi:hypothetical protein ACP26L_15805 [Paenibacillus sp. S-38]|uniref:hypothetical protein n=1 Tax=Paenibacillus sp. S-38 TaxID=3416710 RepID=UPI003CF86D8C